MAVRSVRVRLELDREDFKQGLRDSAAGMRDFDGEVKAVGDSAGRTGVELKDTGTSAKQLGDDAKKSARDTDTLGESVKKVGDESVKTSQKTRQSKASMIEFSDSAKLAGDGVGQLKAHLEELTARHEALKKEFVSSGNTSLLGDVKKSERDIEAVGSLIDKTFSRAVPAAATAGEEAGKTFSSALQGELSTPGISQVLTGVLVVAAVAATPAIIAALNSAVALGFGAGAIALGIREAAQNPAVHDAWASLGKEASTALRDASGPFVQPMIDGAAKIKAAFIAIEPDIKGVFSTLAPTLDNLFTGAAGFTRNIGPGLDKLANFSAPFLDQLAQYLPKLAKHLNEFFDKIAEAGPAALQFFGDFLNGTLVVIDALGDLVQWGTNAYGVISALALAEGGHLAEAAARMNEVMHGNSESAKKLKSDTQDLKNKVDDLGGSIRQLPPAKSTKIETPGAPEAQSRLNKVNDELDRMNGRSVTSTINVVTRYSQTGLPGLSDKGALAHHGGTPQARGGVVAYAAGGVDYKARSGILAPSDPGTILAGEPQTGGEVFTPKLGISNERGLALANVAAGWHGGHVVADGPRGGGGGTATTVNNSYSVTVASAVGTTPAAQGQAIVSAIKAFERDNSAYWRGS